MRLLATCGLLLLCGAASERVGFDVLAGFDYREGMTLPYSVTGLDGDRVTVSGFMKEEDDLAAGDEVEAFVLVNDACGCEGTPNLNELVFCVMPIGEETELRSGVVEVTGTLHVGEIEEDGVVVALYTMDVDDVDTP